MQITHEFIVQLFKICIMVDKMLIKEVLGYTQREWTNPRTGERKNIRTFSLVLTNGSDSVLAEGNDELAERMSGMTIKPDSMACVGLSFHANPTEKDGERRYFQRVRIESFVLL